MKKEVKHEQPKHNLLPKVEKPYVPLNGGAKKQPKNNRFEMIGNYK